MTSSIVKKSARGLKKRDGVEYSDHGSFHGAVLRAMAGAAGGTFFAYLLDWAFSFGLVDSWLFPVVMMAGALAGIAARGRNLAKTAIGGAFGALGGALFALTAGKWALFGPVLLGAAAAPVLADGDSKARKVATALLTAAFSYAGMYVGKVLLALPFLATVLPEPIAAAIAGAAAGLFVGLAAAPKHLARPMDPVERRYLEALSIKDGELHEILARALAIRQSVKHDFEGRADDATMKQLDARVGDLMLRILQIAEQCRTIEGDLSMAPSLELEERIGQLEKKAEAASDEHARKTYRTAIASLDEQRRALRAIGRGRERVVAKLHANVALLEKVRFSLLHLRSADAERFGGESSPLADTLEEIAREIEVTSAAIGEVFGQPEDLLPEPAAAAGALPLPEPAPRHDTIVDPVMSNVVALPEKTTPARDDDPPTVLEKKK